MYQRPAHFMRLEKVLSGGIPINSSRGQNWETGRGRSGHVRSRLRSLQLQQSSRMYAKSCGHNIYKAKNRILSSSASMQSPCWYCGVAF